MIYSYSGMRVTELVIFISSVYDMRIDSNFPGSLRRMTGLSYIRSVYNDLIHTIQVFTQHLQ